MKSEQLPELRVQCVTSPESLALPEALKLVGLSDDFPIEVLGTYPDAKLGQTTEGLTRRTAVNAARKWSNEAYHWCVGMAGFSPSSRQHVSFLTHTATHGEAKNDEQALLHYYRDALLGMLETAEQPARCDAAVFGGAHGHFSSEFRLKLAQLIERESGIEPLVIPPSTEDRMQTSRAKRVFVDTPGARLFYFEPSPQKRMQQRLYRFGGSGR